VELARLRWLWQAVEKGEKGDPDEFRADFLSWVADHRRTHVPFLVAVDGSAVGMASLVIIERVPGPEKGRDCRGFSRACTSHPSIETTIWELC
jgi:hypothetical protein